MTIRQICDEHLPGRAPSEDDALKPFIRAIESGQRKLAAIHRDTRATIAGKHRQIERSSEQRREIEESFDELVAQLHRLGAMRAELLPPDAESISWPNQAADDDSFDRYKVTAFTPRGLVDLGGCSNLGDGMSRMQWFQRLLESRRGGISPSA